MHVNRVGRSFGVLCTLLALCLITNFLVKVATKSIIDPQPFDPSGSKG